MRVSIITINNEILIGKKYDSIAMYLGKKLLESGITISKNIVIQNNPAQILETINTIEDNDIIIIGESSSIRNANIKKTIASYFNENMTLNNEFSNIVKNYYFKNNMPVLLEDENEFYVPQSANIIKNVNGPLQGFYINNSLKNIYFLPSDFTAIKQLYYTEFLPIISKNLDIIYENNIIKTFGICEEDILAILADVIKNKYKILITTFPKNLEVEILVRYNRQLNSEIVFQVVQTIYERLAKYIYADEDIKLENRAFELLKIYNKTLAIAETVSGGNIAENFISHNGNALDYLKESIVCYSKSSQINRLKVSESIINNYTEKSVEFAYEMAAGLLETSGADIVLVNAGSIKEFHDDSVTKTCFIAVGDMDGIHVYKNTFSGSKEQIVDGLTKTSFFYLIKKLKQNDLQFYRKRTPHQSLVRRSLSVLFTCFLLTFNRIFIKIQYGCSLLHPIGIIWIKATY